MKIERTSQLSGKTRVKDIDITQEQLNEINDPDGRLIQVVVPHLSPDDREFLLTGIDSEEWDSMFGEDEEDTF